MTKMQEIHDKVFNLLLKEHRSNQNFLFTMRKTNRNNRLEKGYWFLGNDKYLSVSFWEGMDWINKTSNMYFEINTDSKCLFIFSAKDSAFKLKFAKEKVLPFFQSRLIEYGDEFKFSESEKVFIFNLGRGDYLNILLNFIKNIKPQIDNLIKQFEIEFDTNEQYGKEHEQKYGDKYDFTERDDYKSPIDFLDEKEFQKGLKIIKKYQTKRKLTKIESDGFYIKKIRINKVGDIRNELIVEIPKETSWVFLTGENGCGKTTILRAIAAGFNREIETKFSIFNSNSLIKLEPHIPVPKADLLSFAAYGPSRLISSSCNNNPKDINEKSPSWYGLFFPDGILRGFEELKQIFKVRNRQLENVVNFLEDMFNQKENSSEKTDSNDSGNELLPQIAEVNFTDFLKDGEILYREKDSQNEIYEDYRKFEQLASGTRSLLALIADLLINLIERNQNEPDPANFKAVVLIDEIDIHFHPSMQKKIVEILSGNFPKVQFIVTTHSPVTLLGAPENSVFYKISRSVKEGVTAKRLTKLEKDIKYLLPNTILTSDIFDFNFYDYIDDADFERLKMEDSYVDINKNIELTERLNNLDKDIFPDNLFEEEV